MRAFSSSLVLLVCLSQAITSFGQETSPASTVVKMYRVADLVALPAVRETSLGTTTIDPTEWSGEHSQTLAALHDLAELVDTIVPSEVGAVAAHENSLSLVVRHSPAGQEQIAGLLEQLRERERPVVELTLVPIVGLESSNGKFTDEQTGRMEVMLSQQILNSEETEEFTKILATNAQSSPAFMKPIKTQLANGRKTTLPRWMLAMYVTAVIPENSNEILFRIDNFADEALEGKVKIQTQSFSIPAGHAAAFVTYMDGSSMYWLAIPKRIEQKQQVTALPAAAER